MALESPLNFTEQQLYEEEKLQEPVTGKFYSREIRSDDSSDGSDDSEVETQITKF